METELIQTETQTLSPELLQKINDYWGAANYLSVGQIYLYDHPLLKEPLKLEHVKPLVVKWEPLLSAAEIGVIAKDGVVSFTGIVGIWHLENELAVDYEFAFR